MSIAVRPLEEHHLPDAERVFRLAFGTYLELPDPLQFTGDCAFTRTRWQADPSAGWGAFAGDELIGANIAARWGSFAFFGPLSVHPEFQGRGIAQRLLDVTMARFAEWGVAHAGLFTFAQSAKHIGLYQRYGFYPRFLTAVGGRDVALRGAVAPGECLSALPAPARADAVSACARLTDAILAGLDVRREIDAVQVQALGDTLLLHDGGELAGFAVCHVGPDSEAGSGVCFVKFAAVRCGESAPDRLRRLLELCERFAALRGAAQLVAGVNTAREGAYRLFGDCGFRTFIQGVAMQRPNEPGFNRPDVWVLDDWR